MSKENQNAANLDWEKDSEVRYRNLLTQTEAFLTPTGVEQFQQQLKSLEADYQFKTQPLEDLLQQLKDKHEEERSRLVSQKNDAEREFESSYTIKINPYNKDRSWYEIFPRIYFKDIDFGFCLEDGYLMLKYAVDNKFHPSYFLKHCDSTRKIFLSRFGPNQAKTERKMFFSEEENENYPVTKEVESEFQQGLEKLNTLFVAQQPIPNRHLDPKPHFFLAKSLFQTIEDSTLPKRNLEAIGGLFGFLQTDGVEVFRGPVWQKSQYLSQFSNKQLQRPNEPLELLVDKSEDAVSAIKLIMEANLPSITRYSDGLYLPQWGYATDLQGVYQVVYSMVPKLWEKHV